MAFNGSAVGARAWMVAGTLALATPSLALAEDEVPCIAISGELRSQAVPTPPCTSPIGLCTTGEFSGSFPAQFDFRGDAISAIDPSQPFLQQYTGDVTLTTDDGDQVFSRSAGVINTDPESRGEVADFGSIRGGTGRFQGARGALLIVGTFSFATGTGSSRYAGTVCAPGL